jgi:hypothetical protein
MSSIKQPEAQAMLDYLASVPFENCIELSKEFLELPRQAAIYAVKHRQFGILYIGKTRALRDRFRGGHKALLWAFIEGMDPADIKITFFC